MAEARCMVLDDVAGRAGVMTPAAPPVRSESIAPAGVSSIAGPRHTLRRPLNSWKSSTIAAITSNR
jgi:hypothetical protein